MSVLVNVSFPNQDNHYLDDPSVAYQLIRITGTGAQGSASRNIWMAGVL